MKKYLPIVFFLVCFSKSKSQVVFCPPGAEWHYEFSGTIFNPGITFHETIKYQKDTLEGTDTLKILYHSRFFLFCSATVSRTFIRQKGDTIFMRNKKTQNQWQILYNFSSQVGQKWITTVLPLNQTPTTFTFGVIAITTTTINGFFLKRLQVSNPGSQFGFPTPYITERIGAESFLFPYPNSNPGSCDGNGFMNFLCYSDNTVGTIQFSSKPCDPSLFQGVLNSGVEPQLKIFPNPCLSELNVETSDEEVLDTKIVDMIGRELKSIEVKKQSKIEVSDLSPGLYLLTLFKDGKLIERIKILKE